MFDIYRGKESIKVLSKETLNHPELVELASGIDPFENTQKAYLEAYKSLGIDIINRVPVANAPHPLNHGETASIGNGYCKSYLGVYDSVCRMEYPYKESGDFFEDKNLTLDYSKLITPVPHQLDINVINEKEALLGDVGIYYYQLYTTLFMWGVEWLGWYVYMTAAMMEPKRFDKMFLEPAFKKSYQLIDILCKAESPFVFCHDDLADARGPVFPPEWYDEFIFPRYEKMWQKIHKAGKKVIFVADGNMEEFLPKLRESGVDGVMLENPATNFDMIMDVFGDKIVIGGMDTKLLTFGSPEQIRSEVLKIGKMALANNRLVLSTPGGIHGNIPLQNLESYFDARVEINATPGNWRKKSVG